MRTGTLSATGRSAQVNFDGRAVLITPRRGREISVPVGWLSEVKLTAPGKFTDGKFTVVPQRGYRKPPTVFFTAAQRDGFETLHVALNTSDAREIAARGAVDRAEFEALRPTAPVTGTADSVPVAGPHTTTYEERKKTSHTFHLLATVCTGGAWGATVWAPLGAWHRYGPRRKITQRHHY